MENFIPLVDLKKQHAAIGGEVEARVIQVLRSGGYVGGSEVESFEAEFAAYCGAAQAVSANSGTAALHMALLALGVGPGDEVITVSHTFVATVEAIVATGATPVFVDIDPETFNLDPLRLEAAVTPRTRAILPVHLYGRLADMDAIAAVAEPRGIAVVEDACQAHGAIYKGRRAGSLGTIGCFSFYPSKNLGCDGEGGIAVTSSPELAERMRRLRDHGQSRRYHHVVVGYNYRLPAIQAAILRVKLPHLDGWNEQRRAHARHYDRLLADLPLRVAKYDEESPSVYHLYVVRTKDRDRLAAALTERGIASAVHYPVPVHLQPPYMAFGGGAGSLPHTEEAADEVLSLPMYPELEPAEIERIAAVLAREAALA